MREDTNDAPPTWPAYYEALSGRPPRRLFLSALERFGSSPGGRRAIDLGSGDGVEAEALLRAGWTVLAIDGEPEARTRLEGRIGAELRPNVEVRILAFEEIEALPAADFVYAGLSLPFCRPDAFPRLWQVVKSAVAPSGRLACDLFGNHDSWAGERPDMTFSTRQQAEQLFGEFEIEQFDEIDEDGKAFSGPKHWHCFGVIARRP